jgi:hypothetical protein
MCTGGSAPGVNGAVVKLTNHLLSSAEVKNGGAVPPLTHGALSFELKKQKNVKAEIERIRKEMSVDFFNVALSHSPEVTE